METKLSQRAIEADKIDDLTKAIEHYTSVTQDFKEAYHQLERQISRLNLELEEKNRELQQSLAETKSLQNYLHNILSSMNSGVVCTDANEIITVFNKAAEEMTGYSAREVIGKKYSDLFVSEESGSSQPKEILRQKNTIIQQEKYILRMDGEVLSVRSTMSQLQQNNGDLIGLVEVFEDLTEIRKLEREIQQGRTLMALGEMAGHVAHQIRNPLGAIAGFTTLLERELGKDDPRQRHTRKIMEGVANMEKIIGSLVFLARPLQPSLRKINIRWLLNDVIEHVRFQSKEEGKKIKFDRKIPKSRVEIMADPHLFQQLFLHLFRNSVQAIETEGEIKLLLQKTKNREVRISITDTGVGIPIEVQQRLFHPFAGNGQKGIGLGLPIIRKIVELHLGKIQIKSQINKGTKIIITFPSGM